MEHVTHVKLFVDNDYILYLVIKHVHVQPMNDSLQVLVKLVSINSKFFYFTNKISSIENGQCAPGRVLCQNRLNCAESALSCEQDHTQYTESFKTTARCTLDKPNDGFDCYYAGIGIHNSNHTCIPFEWLCDGVYDCPLGNDEDHCHKMTTTKKPVTKVGSRCLTDKKCKLEKGNLFLFVIRFVFSYSCRMSK